mgnify:CR=1 FL=1
MKIKQCKIKVKDIFEGYKNDLEEGVVGYGGKLNIRPPYQREFVYKDKQRDEVFAQLKILNPNLLSLKTLFYNRFFILDDYYKPIKEKHSDEFKRVSRKARF